MKGKKRSHKDHVLKVTFAIYRDRVDLSGIAWGGLIGNQWSDEPRLSGIIVINQ